MPAPASIFPLRWESTGDQWWYVSPIDYAAANGHYELVRELLYIGTNLLIKLTSLRRIRRLETVWEDDDNFNDVAKSRAFVAKNLLTECEVEAGHNSLIRAGYGGWLLYTAASAGDLGFVRDLLERDPLIVFGEGEYGITDVLYAAARSGNSEVFKVLMKSAVGMKRFDGEKGEFCDGFRWEMMNRGVHCAARGGNLELLKELLGGCGDVLPFRDALGSTILHSAAGRGQVKIVKYLIASYTNIINSTDNQGNTSLHIAAYKGFWSCVEALLTASPSLATSTNKEGNTFLHTAISGFQTPGFHRLDQQLKLVEKLVTSKTLNIQEIINAKNNQGRTALHLAVAKNIQFNAVQLLMTVPGIALNVQDSDGKTPLDILKQHPQSGSSRLLIKSMVSAGGTVSYREDHMARDTFASYLKIESGVGNSPGTSFRVADSEIFLYATNDDDNNSNSNECDNGESLGFSSDSDEIVNQCRSCVFSGGFINSSSNNTRRSKKYSMNSALARLKVLLQWPKTKARVNHNQLFQSLDEETTRTPLRQRFSKNQANPMRYEIPKSPMHAVLVQQARSPSRSPKLFKGSHNYLSKKLTSH